MQIEKQKIKPIKVAVLVPVTQYDNEEFLKCIESLRYTLLPSFVEMEIFSLKNQMEGFAFSVNKGIQMALEKEFDFIAILNSDIKVVPHWLNNLIGVFKQSEFMEKNVGIAVDKGGYRGNHVVFYCALIKRQVFELIGLFDERFFPAYVEDVDFSVRCRDAGIEFGYVDEYLCLHKVQSAISHLPDKEEMIAGNWAKFKEKWKETKWENFKEGEDKKWQEMLKQQSQSSS